MLCLKEFEKALLDFHLPSLEPCLQKKPQVVLITGIPGIGKRQVGLALARKDFCDHLGCDRCISCQQALANQHLHFYSIPFDSSDGEHYGIQSFQIFHEIKARGSDTTQVQSFLIPDIQKMRSKTCESMLKILEEPPSHWRIFLTVPNSSLIPKTLFSRCFELKLKPLSEAWLTKHVSMSQSSLPFLSKIFQKPLALVFAEGSLERALRFQALEQKGTLEILDQFFFSPKKGFSALFSALQEDKKNILFFCEFSQIMIKELLKKESFAKLPERLMQWESLSQIIEDLDSPINSKILLQTALGSWIL